MSIDTPLLTNRLVKANTDNSTSILMIASDGSGHASYAALIAAGKVPFPGKPRTVQQCSVENVTDVTKSFRVAWNTKTTPDADGMTLVPGNVAQFTFPGAVKYCWIQKETGTNHLVFTGLY